MEGEGAASLRAAAGSQVFVMLNGENEGIFVTSSSKNSCDCLGSVSSAAAKGLGARKHYTKHFLTPLVVPVTQRTCGSQMEKHNYIVHLLLDQEVWVWPGVEIGYKWNLTMNSVAWPDASYRNPEGGGRELAGMVVSMETVSLSPKAILVKGFATQRECDDIIQQGA